MPTTITRDDVRFANLNKAHNARYPKSAAENVSAIAICQNKDDVAEALQSAISTGKRPTIRASGSCYEDFYINNPNGVLIDVVQLDFVGNLPHDPRYHIGPGVSMGKAYEDLYRIGNVTLPGASCTNVTAGGHITGGGFGVFSRMFSVTTDWVTEIEILTVDANGKVVPRTINAKRDPDLFRACRGSGGGNFGIITDYIFDKLPTAPQEIASSSISFSWADMTEAKFTKIMQTYGNYFATRGKDQDTWGIFAGIGLGHASSTSRLGIGVQFCGPDGTANDLKVLEEFIAYFDSIGGDVAPITRTQRGQGPAQNATQSAAQAAAITRGGQQFGQTCAVCHGMDAHGGSIGPDLTSSHAIALTDAENHGIIQSGVGGKMPGFSSLSEQQVQELIAYLRSQQGPRNQDGQNGGRRNAPAAGEKTSVITTATGPHNVSYTQFIDNVLGSRTSAGTRAKYKSTYKSTSFTQHECSVFFKYMTEAIPGTDSSGATVLIDSYGGAVNRKEMGDQTVIYQRDSIMKHQFLTYWTDPAQDAPKIAFLNNLYRDLYTSSDVDPNHQGTPYPSPGGIYQGCYMNYPDADMLAYPYWPELYWGPNYKFLQQVKKKYDPNNIFHHAMSIRA